MEIKNSYKHWTETVERLYIMHDHVVGLEADTQATTDKSRMACLIAKAQPCFRASFDWLAPNRTNHESRGTRIIEDENHCF